VLELLLMLLLLLELHLVQVNYLVEKIRNKNLLLQNQFSSFLVVVV
jgi:hypothetical protein